MQDLVALGVGEQVDRRERPDEAHVVGREHRRLRSRHLDAEGAPDAHHLVDRTPDPGGHVASGEALGGGEDEIGTEPDQTRPRRGLGDLFGRRPERQEELGQFGAWARRTDRPGRTGWLSTAPAWHPPPAPCAPVRAPYSAGRSPDEAQARPARDLQPWLGHRPGAAGHHRRGGAQEGHPGRDHPGQGVGPAEEAGPALPRHEGDEGPLPPGGEGLAQLRAGLRPLPLEVTSAGHRPVPCRRAW